MTEFHTKIYFMKKPIDYLTEPFKKKESEPKIRN